MVSLDVKESFDVTWWPVILKGLRDAKCPRNLYKLTQYYMREREREKSSNVI
jgi:hypothetical protein